MGIQVSDSLHYIMAAGEDKKECPPYEITPIQSSQNSQHPYQSPEPLGQAVVADNQWAQTRAPGGKPDYPITTPIHDLGHLPALVDCPYCGLRGRTVTSLSSGNMNHAWACCLFFHSVIFTFLPYMVSGLKNVEHRCQGCEKLVAVWHRTGHTQVK